MMSERLSVTRYVAAVLVGVALLAAVSTAEATAVIVDGIKVKYDRPLANWGAYYDPDDGTLTVEIEPQAAGGVLIVKPLPEAVLWWPGYVDIYIFAPDAYIKKIDLKGKDWCRFYVVGEVDSADKFKLTWGVVGSTDYYGWDVGLYQWDFDPWGINNLRWPLNIKVKNGFTTAPVLAPMFVLGARAPVKGEKFEKPDPSKSEVLRKDKAALWQDTEFDVYESEQEEVEQGNEEDAADDASCELDVSAGDAVGFFQSLLLGAE
jgi:hypothetical protein